MKKQTNKQKQTTINPFTPFKIFVWYLFKEFFNLSQPHSIATSLSVIGLGGAKNGSKKGRGIFIEKHKGRLHFGSSQALYTARIPFKTFSLEPSITLLQDALVWS